jgi:phospholipid/cholesterol/gamma-HCH transport system substrate-binding protein
MLTRFVRIQLIIFTIASVVGMSVMAIRYLQVQSFLGIGRMNVTLELTQTGGLYRFSNVTYRGVQVGEVTAVELTKTGVRATLSLQDSTRIPADVDVKVRSVSAVGEQYIDLRPQNDSPPYLRDGSVISSGKSAIPQPVGPMLDRASALISSIPKESLYNLLDELDKGFNGAEYDLQSLLDSSAKITGDVTPAADQLRTLLQDSAPLLDTQDETRDAIETWTRSLAGVTDQLVTNDPQVRSLLQQGPGLARDATQLLDQLKMTVPVLLANLTTVSQLAVTYNPALEQILVLLPPVVSVLERVQPGTNASGLGIGSFHISLNDPPACTTGFLPPSSWRSPEDTTTIDTPDNLYCKLPQDSPIAVRGVRNIPCMGKPGKRAPTAEICNSDQEFEPIADRQPVLGPYPRDPALEAQGVPPDSRWFPDQGLYAPPGQGPPAPTGPQPPPPADASPAFPYTPPGPGGVSAQVPPIAGPPAPPGAPLPPDGVIQVPPGFPPQPGGIPVPDPPPPGRPAPPEVVSPPLTDMFLPPTDVPPPVPGSAPAVAPASSSSGDVSPTPSVRFARYDPRTGEYVGPDGGLHRQLNLVTTAVHRTWEDLLPTS